MHEESERAVRERIDSTRERLGETIEEIGDRVNPDRVQREIKARAREEVDELKDTMKRKARTKMRDVEHGVNEAGRGVWHTIRENPIPSGMVGVGLAWLMANGSSSSRTDRYYATSDRGYRAGPAVPYGVGHTGAGAPLYAEGHDDDSRVDEMKDKARARASEAADRASDAADRVREKGERAMERTMERGEHALDTARDRASEWADRTQYQARRLEHRVEDSVQDNPLAAGAVAAAIGFAAGLMIPESRREREWMGPTRDRVMDRAQSTVRRAASKAKDVARETASESARQAVDEVWPNSSDAERDEERDAVVEPGR